MSQPAVRFGKAGAFPTAVVVFSPTRYYGKVLPYGTREQDVDWAAMIREAEEATR